MAIENVSCLSSLFRAHPAVEALYRSMDGEANPAGWAPACCSPVACCGMGLGFSGANEAPALALFIFALIFLSFLLGVYLKSILEEIESCARNDMSRMHFRYFLLRCIAGWRSIKSLERAL